MVIPNLLVKNGTNPTSRHSNCMDAGIEALCEDLRFAEIFMGRPQFDLLDFAGILIPKQLFTCLNTEQLKEEG